MILFAFGLLLNNLDQLPKNYVFAYFSLVIDGRMISGISGESARHFLYTDLTFANYVSQITL